MNKYDEMVVRITIFCREPLNFGLLLKEVDFSVLSLAEFYIRHQADAYGLVS